MGREGEKEKEKKQLKARGPKWALWETHLAVDSVIATRDKFASGIGTAEMLREFNRFYEQCLEECEQRGECVDHNGLPDRRVTPVMSKQHRISEVATNARVSSISRQFEKTVVLASTV